ncbi:hypothetical protein DFH09DRAFT_246116 [Mycena vulgaris]|nr:hypothetical protein DFH09DRAFT_246116 [Mycena vulgaris]
MLERARNSIKPLNNGRTQPLMAQHTAQPLICQFGGPFSLLVLEPSWTYNGIIPVSTMSRVHLASPVQANGEVKCLKHDLVLKKLVSHTSKNPDRPFYSCDAADGAGGATCKFFKWEDELVPPPSQPSSLPLTPQKRPASTAEHEFSPAQKRPNASHQAPTSSPRNPASQARLDAILRAHGLPAAGPSRSPPSSPSSSRTPDVQQGSPTLSPLASWCIPPQSTPQYLPMTPPATAERTERRWPPQTPPSSRAALLKHVRTQSGMSTEVQSDEDDPSGTSFDSDARLDADPFSSPSGNDTRSGGSEPHEVAPHPFASADPKEVSAAAYNVIDSANRTAALIMQLERRLSAAEKSNDAKARKIELMQEEMDRLKARNARLERSLADLT